MKAVKTEFNFLPPSILEQRAKRRRIIRWSPLVLGVVLSLIALFYAPQYMAGRYRAEIDRVDQEYAYLTPAMAYFNQAQELQAKYQARQQAMAQINGKKVPLVEIIDGISGVVPPGVKVTRLAVNAGSGVTLDFETDSALPTARFIVGLRTLPFFGAVEPQQVPLRGSLEAVSLELPFKGAKPADQS